MSMASIAVSVLEPGVGQSASHCGASKQALITMSTKTVPWNQRWSTMERHFALAVFQESGLSTSIPHWTHRSRNNRSLRTTGSSSLAAASSLRICSLLFRFLSSISSTLLTVDWVLPMENLIAASFCTTFSGTSASLLCAVVVTNLSRASWSSSCENPSLSSCTLAWFSSSISRCRLSMDTGDEGMGIVDFRTCRSMPVWKSQMRTAATSALTSSLSRFSVRISSLFSIVASSTPFLRSFSMASRACRVLLEVSMVSAVSSPRISTNFPLFVRIESGPKPAPPEPPPSSSSWMGLDAASIKTPKTNARREVDTRDQTIT